MNYPKVAIIILNWNGWEDTVECLESLKKNTYPNYEMIVVDNSSERNDADILEKKYKDYIKVIRNKQNLGFAGGCNVGISYALGQQADYVFIVNNDVVATPDILNHLVAVAQQADASIVGARVLNEKGTQILFAGSHWPTQLFFGSKTSQTYPDQPFWPSRYAQGCALFLRKDLLKQRFAECGHFLDPRFFMYCEETDFCLYGRSRGYRCVIARDAVVYHGLAKSSGGAGNPRSYYYLTRNRIFLANRWLSLPWKILFHLYYIPSRLALQILHIGQGQSGVSRAVISGLMDGYRGIMGKWRRYRGRYA